MRTEVIKADTIDVALEKILIELGADTRSSRENAIYFDGWDGLGASAVLQAIAQRLAISNDAWTKPIALQFEKIIHIDCSKWESRRAMQREVAEQLKLPNWVMEMFDKEDEEDDFNGLDLGSRSEIAQVAREIYQATQNSKFLVILHNGSNWEIDIFKFGLYIYGHANSKLLWTFQGRFRLDPKMMDNMKKSVATDVLLSASRDQRDPHDLWYYLVFHEAAQVSCNKHGRIIIDPDIVIECVLYILKQCSIGSHVVDYDWAVHTSNYWVCDEIITLVDIEKAWQVADILQHEVRSLGTDNRLNISESTKMSSFHLARSTENMPYWISTATCGFVLSPSGVMPDHMFQYSHRLRVLKLSRCAFSFSTPPFLCCRSLRFMWLEHCQDIRTRKGTTDEHHTDADKEEEFDSNTTMSWECFQSLWVLDVRYTDWDQIMSTQVMDLMCQLRELNVVGAKNWDMSHLRGRLRSIRKLRVTKSTCFFNNDVFVEMESMELLEFSGNTIRQGMTSFRVSASKSSLKTVIIDGCDGLKSISFRYCKELKNLFLKGSLGILDELDLSCTKVKTLDLGGVQSTVPRRIILLGCEKLHAILWPEGLKRPDVLQIDTTSTSISADGGEALGVHPHDDRFLQEENYKDGWQISLMDARLLRSLYPVRHYLEREAALHIDIYSPAILAGSNFQGARSDKIGQVQPRTSTVMESEYIYVLKDGPVEVMMMWECPKIRRGWWDHTTCIIKVITHGQPTNHLEDDTSGSTCALSLPSFIYQMTNSLHVYDNSSITSIPTPPKGPGWKYLVWCRVERCPRLHTVFTLLHGSDLYTFENLETLWASQLLSTRYIWDRPYGFFFIHLKFLHLDHCPRLICVLPMSTLQGEIGLYSLVTLEIVYCGDLEVVFRLNPDFQEQDKVIEFPNLRQMHLHELPKLQHICGRRMSAPKLETIKIRGCWSLRRLPAVGHDTKPPKVDCEKEWWDNLEWDGLEEYHHPSLYEPSHPLYYKAQLPRVSVLR